jgi:hypothetical protein
MSYSCTVLADSVNPAGIRLTTVEITFPRFLLAELNTHRMLSRNSASSRAIPTEKQIERVQNDPFIPNFNRRVTGMGVGEALPPRLNRRYQAKWLDARDSAVIAALGMLDVDKSRANRLLEPFMWHTAIVSATEWKNFFHLRNHEAAQPEFRELASLMEATLAVSLPKHIDWGAWHLPLWFEEDALKCQPDIRNEKFPAEVSAGRCARVSYDRQHEGEALVASAGRWATLSQAGHWSPGEHPARSMTDAEWDSIMRAQDDRSSQIVAEGRAPVYEWDLRPMEFCGNFRGYVQLRKHYPGEGVFPR